MHEEERARGEPKMRSIPIEQNHEASGRPMPMFTATGISSCRCAGAGAVSTCSHALPPTSRWQVMRDFSDSQSISEKYLFFLAMAIFHWFYKLFQQGKASVLPPGKLNTPLGKWWHS